MSELANDLAEEGFRVILLTLEGADCPDFFPISRNVERRRIQIHWRSSGIISKIYSFIRRFLLLRRAIVEAKPDIVVSFIDTTNIRILGSCLFTGIPVIVSERTDPRRHAIGSTWTWLRRLLYPAAARVVVQTRQVANWMRGEMKGLSIDVIPNAARSSGFIKTKWDGVPLPTTAYRDQGRARMISVGRLVPSKRLDLMIAGFGKSGLAAHGWDLIVVGDGPEMIRLERLISSLALSNVVHLVGRQSDVALWLAHSDIFVATSEYEGFPNALLEAMQCGLPCIATDCESGPADLIESDRQGILIAVNDEKALISAMVSLATSVELREAMGQAAKASCERYQPRIVTAQWKALILSETNAICEKKRTE
jgi:glycosyltransferase involved in cell wall biosynthesis